MARRLVFKDGPPTQIKVAQHTKLRLEAIGAKLSLTRGYRMAPAEVVALAVDALEQQVGGAEVKVATK